MSSRPQDNEGALARRALLSAGQALYIAGAFESKCQFVLRIAQLATFASKNPDADLADGIASIAKDKLLHPTLDALMDFPIVRLGEDDILNNARKARNFIAHKGADLGPVYAVSDQSIWEHLHRLRGEVAALAAGDNIVSRWVYEIEEKEPAPSHITADYPTMVDRWIFGWMDS